MNKNEELVPTGTVLIGVNYSAKTGNLKHTLLMNDDVDPGVLKRIALSLPQMKVKRVRYDKLRLPPQARLDGTDQGGSWRSFRHRIYLSEGEARSSLKDPLLVRQIAEVVLANLFEKMGLALNDLTDETLERA